MPDRGTDDRAGPLLFPSAYSSASVAAAAMAAAVLAERARFER